MFLLTYIVFVSGKCLVKILFFLGPVFEIDFRERTFGSVSWSSLLFLGGVLPMSFAYLLGLSFPEGLEKFASS